MLIIKEHQQDVKTNGITDKVNPDTLEEELIDIIKDGEDHAESITTIIDITSIPLEQKVEEEDLDDIMDAIHAMKSDKSVSIDENIPKSHNIHTKETYKE